MTRAIGHHGWSAALIVIVWTLAVPVTAQQPGVEQDAARPGEEPWRVSTEKRISARVEAYAKHHRDASAGTAFVISGEMEPELLLPFELFVKLVGRAFAEDPGAREYSRQVYAERSQGFVTGDEFWTRLENAIGNYLAVEASMRGAYHEIVTEQDAEERARLQREVGIERCRARTVALETAGSVFGEDRFLRFLYEAVAPDMNMYAGEVDADHLRYLARGCK